VAEFQDQDSGWLEMRGGLRDEIGVEFVAFFTAIESDFWFMIADLAHERCGFVAADVGRIAGDQMEGT